MNGWLRAAIVLILVSVSLAGLALTATAGDATRWPIRWLQVEGQLHRVTAAQVRAALAAEATPGFFALDMVRARDAIEALPWVARAQVSKTWPDTLDVHVTEHRPVARFNSGALVSARGEAFEVAGTSGMQGLVQLFGPPDQLPEMFSQWQGMQRRLAPEGLEIRSLHQDARGAWAIELENGVQLLLGREQLQERLNRFLTVQEALQARGPLQRVDLRYPNGLALVRPPRPTPDPDARRTDQRDPSSRQDIHG